MLPKIITACALALVALPAAAHASSLSRYRIWDAGAVLKERFNVCVYPRRGYERVVRERTRIETDDGSDSRSYTGQDWYSRGCWTVTNRLRDDLEFEGWYYARLRLSIPATGEVLYTGWRRFWSS